MSKINLPEVSCLNKLVEMLSGMRKTQKETTVKVSLSKDYNIDELKRSTCYCSNKELSVILTCLSQIEGFLGSEASYETFQIKTPVRILIRENKETGLSPSVFKPFIASKLKDLKSQIEKHELSLEKSKAKAEELQAKLDKGESNFRNAHNIALKAIENASNQVVPLKFLCSILDTCIKEYPKFNETSKYELLAISPTLYEWERLKLSTGDAEKALTIFKRLWLLFTPRQVLNGFQKLDWHLCKSGVYDQNGIKPMSSGQYLSQNDPDANHHRKAIVCFNQWAPFFGMAPLRFKDKSADKFSLGVINSYPLLVKSFKDVMSFILKKGIDIPYVLDLPKEEEEKTETSSDDDEESSQSDNKLSLIPEEEFYIESLIPVKTDLDSICAMVYRVGFWNLDVSPSWDTKLHKFSEKALNRMSYFQDESRVKSSLFPNDWCKYAVSAVRTEDGVVHNASDLRKFLMSEESKSLLVKVSAAYDKWLQQRKVLFLEGLKLSVKSERDVPKVEKLPVKTAPKPQTVEPKKKKPVIPDDPNQLKPKGKTEVENPKSKVKTSEKKPPQKEKKGVQRNPGQSRVEFYGISPDDIDQVCSILKITDEKKRIPNWCVTGLGRFGKTFLSDLKAHKVSKNNFSTWVQKNTTVKSSNQTAIELAWSKVRARFKGVPLVSNPSTPTEKAYFAEFKKFNKIYPNWKNKPKVGQGKRSRLEVPKVPSQFGSVSANPVDLMFGGDFMIKMKAFKDMFQTMQSMFIMKP